MLIHFGFLFTKCPEIPLVQINTINSVPKLLLLNQKINTSNLGRYKITDIAKRTRATQPRSREVRHTFTIQKNETNACNFT